MENSIQEKPENGNKMDRRIALAKTGKYAAFTALTMMAILTPQRLAAQSPAPEDPALLPPERGE